MYQETEWSPAWCRERHVKEDPEIHEKVTIGWDGSPVGTGELEDPHCDWCWEPWPCDTAKMVEEWEDAMLTISELRLRIES